jgi:biotin carboxylase
MTRMKEAIVFIESSGSGAGEATAMAARELGIVPIVLCSDAAAYPFFNQLSVESRVVDTKSLDSLLEACLRLGKEYTIVGAGTTAEYFAEITARVARHFQLPGPDPESVAMCRAKDRMRAALENKTSLNPRYYLVRTPEEAAAVAKALNAPVIIKPTILSGSALVQLCHDDSNAYQHARKLLEIEIIDGLRMPGHILVEEYVDGPEFSVEVLNSQSLGITKKKLGPSPFFVEIGHDFPADLDDRDWNAVTKAALEAAAAVGLHWGPAHIEVKLSRQGPRIIEVNPRMAGGRIPHLIRYATGFDFAAAYVSNLAGRVSTFGKTEHGAASVRFVTVPEDGVLQGISGAETIENMDGIMDVKVTGGIGTRYRLLRSNGDRIGYIIAIGSCLHESAARAEMALQHLTLQWDSESSGNLVSTSTA